MAELIIVENDNSAEIACCLYRTETLVEIIGHLVIAVTGGCEKYTNDKDKIPSQVRTSFPHRRVIFDGFL